MQRILPPTSNRRNRHSVFVEENRRQLTDSALANELANLLHLLSHDHYARAALHAVRVVEPTHARGKMKLGT